jgi:hypothetical protein
MDQEESRRDTMRERMPLKLLSCLAVICLLSITLLPNVQFVSVRADLDHRYHRITIKPCGLKDVGPATVDLTAEQYHALQQYLVLFRERLNTTVDYKETARLYAEALTELANLHLIPRSNHLNLPGGALVKNANDVDYNIFALVTGSLRAPDNFLPPLYLLLQIPLLLVVMILTFAYYNLGGYRPPLVFAIGYLLATFAQWRLDSVTHSPVSFLNNIDGPAIGWVHSLGLNGIKQWSGLLTTRPHFFSCPIIVGFTGYKIFDEQNETHFFIGACLYVKITVL